MLDDPLKTLALLEQLKTWLPLEVRLTPALARILQAQSIPAHAADHYHVQEVFYAGDEGGIMCRIESPRWKSAAVVSITHLVMRPADSWAREVAAYQKHRIKKLKKSGRA